MVTSGGGGNDTISLNETNGALPRADLRGGRGGADSLFSGRNNDRMIWNPGDGNDTLEGQAGTDKMVFVGSGASENIDISANGGRVLFFRNVANVLMDINDVEGIDFNALGGADTTVVNDLSGPT